jgi:hypothetical protein
VDLGSFGSFIHRHERDRTFYISFLYDRVVGRRSSRYGYLDQGQKRRVTTAFRAVTGPSGRKKDSSELASVRYEIVGAPGLDVRLSRSDAQPELEYAAVGPSRTVFYDWADEESFKSYVDYAQYVQNRVPGLSSRRQHRAPTETELKELYSISKMASYGGLPSAVVLTSEDAGDDRKWRPTFRSLDGFVTEFYELLESISYLGPLRSYPARHYLIMGGEEDSVGIRGENTPQMIFRRKGEIERQINEWFRRFEIPYTLKIRSIGDEVTGEIIAMTLLDHRSQVEVAPSDVGFGIGQLLPIIVESIIARRRVLCVEQPEIHLHPRLQAHIADLLIESSGLIPLNRREAVQRFSPNQWIVETHSEALMIRLQRRIREKVISNKDVCVLYVEPIGDRGSQVVELRLDEHGEFIDEWPDGFFDEGYREIFGS